MNTSPQILNGITTKVCQYCRRSIASSAVKCVHCNAIVGHHADGSKIFDVSKDDIVKEPVSKYVARMITNGAIFACMVALITSLGYLQFTGNALLPAWVEMIIASVLAIAAVVSRQFEKQA